MKQYISHYQLELFKPWTDGDFYKTLIKYDYILTRDDHNGLMIHTFIYKNRDNGPVPLSSKHRFISFIWIPQIKKFEEMTFEFLSTYNYHTILGYLMDRVKLLEFIILDKKELLEELSTIEGASVAWLELKLEKNE